MTWWKLEGDHFRSICRIYIPGIFNDVSGDLHLLDASMTQLLQCAVLGLLLNGRRLYLPGWVGVHDGSGGPSAAYVYPFCKCSLEGSCIEGCSRGWGVSPRVPRRRVGSDVIIHASVLPERSTCCRIMITVVYLVVFSQAVKCICCLFLSGALNWAPAQMSLKGKNKEID